MTREALGRAAVVAGGYAPHVVEAMALLALDDAGAPAARISAGRTVLEYAVRLSQALRGELELEPVNIIVDV